MDDGFEDAVFSAGAVKVRINENGHRKGKGVSRGGQMRIAHWERTCHGTSSRALRLSNESRSTAH
jgi:hypothetical protein